MKKLYLVFMVICMAALVSCFSPWEGEEGMITLVFSGESGIRAAAGITPLNTGFNSYEIRLTGPGGRELRQTVTLPDEMGQGSRIAQIAVPPGDWIVSVREYHGGDAFQRIGFSESVTVRAGQSVGAPVEMMDAAKVSTYGHLRDALGIASNYRVIVLTGSIGHDERFDIDRDITLISDGDFTIYRVVNHLFNNHDFFSIGGNSRLTLGMPGMSGSITIDGDEIEAQNSLIYIASGTLVMHSGVTLTGGILANDVTSTTGSAVTVGDNGAFIMHGGTITGNQGGRGAVVVSLHGVFYRTGGTIFGNLPGNEYFE